MKWGLTLHLPSSFEERRAVIGVRPTPAAALMSPVLRDIPIQLNLSLRTHTSSHTKWGPLSFLPRASRCLLSSSSVEQCMDVLYSVCTCMDRPPLLWISSFTGIMAKSAASTWIVLSHRDYLKVTLRPVSTCVCPSCYSLVYTRVTIYAWCVHICLW